MFDWPLLLARLDTAIAWFTGTLGAGGPAALVLLALPLLLALLSRNAQQVLVTLLLALLALVLLRRAELDLALVLYGVAWLSTLHAVPNRDLRRRLEASTADLARLRRDISVYLEALDRRSRELDKPQPAADPPKRKSA